MYDIVNDVENYPEFLPWCGGVRIDHADRHSLQAAILMQAAGLDHWFTTANRMRPGESIDISLVDGPFKQLQGNWRFTAIEDEACKIELILQYEIKHNLAAAVISPAFSRIANTMVDSFCKRARDLDDRQDPD
jgi:ribosome-associated toxin RatA of RatAB toxin-antitoxin module